MKKIAVIGAGGWGTALAITLENNGHSPWMWDIDKAHLQEMRDEKENSRYLPGVKLPDGITVCDDEAEVLKDADMVLFSVPAQHFASAFETALPMLPEGVLILNVAKGIDRKTLKRMSEIAFSMKDGLRYVVLSGPSHAEEVGRKMPTTVAVASANIEDAVAVQDLLMNDYFRIYTNDDVAGLELGGALKNIIALGAGIADGLGYGDNAKAAMMTRGIVEMERLGARLGAKPSTFTGLSGIGDLIVTCCSMHSRNRRCGILIGQGMKPEDAVKEVGMVVEGMYTADAAYRLSRQLGVEMPITEAIYNVVNGNIEPDKAVRALMTRSRKRENEEVFG
ncbi:MAG: NAD(P)H-dependent glycerol-3-phosphate dehydrogenase [Firmicutes bacterium]|nr:NAD(P)H-dependent glycerol-3-phosphate dehydrogenase [Bacillota bacterium]